MIARYSAPALTIALLLSATCPGVDFDQSRRSDWPFIGPEPEVLRTMPRKVFAHYHTQFPRSFDNAPDHEDYYRLQYLSPAGEGGRHAGYGGFLRDRPLPRDPIAGDWLREDLRWEVACAASLGIDGFCVDLLEPDGVHFARALELTAAAAASGTTFRVVPMPDFAAGYGLRPECFVTTVARFSKEPGAYRMDDGRLLVMAYDAQRMPPQWWRDQIDLLEACDIRIALVPCVRFLNQHRDAFLPFSEGIGEWGVRTPAGVAAEPDAASPIHALHRIWMAPVSPQDFRPKDLLAMEAEGLALFDGMWRKAMNDKADWVQLITWNDYSEHTHIEPSERTGWLWYDLTGWYVSWFKTGRQPAVVRDAIYLAWRSHRIDDPGTTGSRSRFDPPGSGKDVLGIATLCTEEASLVVDGRPRLTGAGFTVLTLPRPAVIPVISLERMGRSIVRVPDLTVGPAGQEDLLYRGSVTIAPFRADGSP